jgi:hypothetical protein
MSTYPPPNPGPGSIGQRIDEAIELIEMEVRHAAAYINSAVIPQVRSESITALRNISNSLRSFADRLDQNQPQNQAQKPPQPPTSSPPTSGSGPRTG